MLKYVYIIAGLGRAGARSRMFWPLGSHVKKKKTGTGAAPKQIGRQSLKKYADPVPAPRR